MSFDTNTKDLTLPLGGRGGGKVIRPPETLYDVEAIRIEFKKTIHRFALVIILLWGPGTLVAASLQIFVPLSALPLLIRPYWHMGPLMLVIFFLPTLWIALFTRFGKNWSDLAPFAKAADHFYTAQEELQAWLIRRNMGNLRNAYAAIEEITRNGDLLAAVPEYESLRKDILLEYQTHFSKEE